ncbi:hypothetical protein SAMN02745129_2639 [Ferrimonas marina]|uniref:Uncharacterized protein n=2 Tax=Ferrimonas marina TaxID=299255 RepID=A0A1M5UMJ6_9GAMM|nr:hypothetical protein SAMN02745129_2639 [Ferrimonas marina]
MKALRQPVPADFTAAVQHIAQHARDLAMFREMLSPSMFDLSDRNLTRIGRAAQWFGREEADTLAGQGQVTIFRKVPSGRGYEIESGDWVAIDPGYAEGHSPQNQNVDGEVLSMTVPGEHVFMGVDANEWVYINPVDWGDFASLAEVYEHFSQVRAIEDPCIGTWYEAGVVAKGQGREAMHSLGFFRDEAKAKSVAEDHAKASGFVGLIACFENLPLRVVETLPVCAEVSGSLLQSMADQFAEAVRIDSSDGPGLLRTPRFGIEPETVVLYTGRWGRHYSPDHADNRLLRHNRSEELGR